MGHVQNWINLFWQLRFVDDLPEMSNAALVLVGVILYFQRYIGWVEQHPKFRDFLCGTCLILAAGGGYVSIHQRHDAERDAKGLVGNTNNLINDTRTLVAETEKIVSNTSDTRQKVDNLTFMFQSKSVEKTELEAKIASTSNPIEAAKLKSQLATNETLLKIATQEVVSGMKIWTEKFAQDDNSIANVYLLQKNAALTEASRTGVKQLNLGSIAEAVENVRLEEAKNNAAQVSDLIKHANALREQLLKGSEMTPDDYNNQAIFSNLLAGQPLTFREMLDITRYMQALVQRKLPDSVNR
jgi:hypothetical protein